MPSNVLNVPADVALCPYCASPLYLEVDEWDAETRQPTEGGAHIHCVAEAEDEDLACREGPDSEAARQWREMGRWHDQMPYVYWLPAQIRVYRLFGQHCRVLDAPNGDTQLVYVPPPVPPAEEMRRAGAAPLPGF